MLKNAFAGQAERPTEKQLAAELGTADVLWKNLIKDLRRDLNLDAEEWNSSSLRAGWSLRLQLKKRNIVYLAPSTGSFLTSFALGERAVAESFQPGFTRLSITRNATLKARRYGWKYKPLRMRTL
jgi:hypothetical protein